MPVNKFMKIRNLYQKYVVPIACIMIIVGSVWACIDLQKSPYPWAGYVLVITAIFLGVGMGREAWREQWRKENK
jgi:hypothetical protein